MISKTLHKSQVCSINLIVKKIHDVEVLHFLFIFICMSLHGQGWSKQGRTSLLPKGSDQMHLANQYMGIRSVLKESIVLT